MNNINIHVTYPTPAAGAVGSKVKVSATYTWTYPLLSDIAGSLGMSLPGVTMTPSGTARLEQTVSPATGC